MIGAHPAGFDQAKSGWRGKRFSGLAIHQRLVGQVGRQQIKCAGEQVGIVGRVQKNQVPDGVCRLQELEGVGCMNGDAFGFEQGNGGPQCLGSTGCSVHECCCFRTAGMRFQAQRSTARKQIQTARVNAVPGQPVEQGNSRTTECRPDCGIAMEVKLSTFPLTADNADLVFQKITCMSLLSTLPVAREGRFPSWLSPTHAALVHAYGLNR